MDLRIKYIILWPKNRTKPIRKIEFDISKVNIITGKTQTGKSALIPIIDYCLGSIKCTIPVGIIRKKTEWFGLLLQLENTQILLARREPGQQNQSTEMYMDEAISPKIVERPSSTCNVNAVKNRLNELAGLPTLDFTGGNSETTFTYRPSFRDLSAFEFQPQHIVANPYTLFFKADTYGHREKLKTIFPLVLGAIDNKYLALKRELRDLERELDNKKRELENRKSSANAWIAELKGLYSQGRELGLMSDAPNPDADWTPQQYIRYLKQITQPESQLNLPKVDEGGTERVVKELVSLKNEELEISHDIGIRRIKLSKVEQLASSSNIYEKALDSQLNRLESIGWFAEKIKDRNICPFCGSEHESAYSEIKNLLEMAKEAQQSSQAVQNVQSILDKEIADIKKQIRDLETKLNIVRTHRQMLESKSNDLKVKRQILSEIYRYIGRLEQSLENLRTIEDSSDLNESVRNLEGHISELRRELDPSSIEKKLSNAISRISMAISHYSEILGVERPKDPVHLDTTNLTIKILSELGREDYLWEIGS